MKWEQFVYFRNKVLVAQYSTGKLVTLLCSYVFNIHPLGLNILLKVDLNENHTTNQWYLWKLWMFAPKYVKNSYAALLGTITQPFLYKNTLFKGEGARQPLKLLQSWSPSILKPLTSPFKWSILCLFFFLLSLVV